MFVWGFCCTALPPGQNRKHFADCRQFFQMHCFYINMFCFSLNFTDVCSCIPNWNKSALVYIMPWYQNMNVKACLHAPPPPPPPPKKKKKKKNIAPMDMLIIHDQLITPEINRMWSDSLFPAVWLWYQMCDFQMHCSVYFHEHFAIAIAFNSLCAKFFRGNINMYLHFMSFLHTDMPMIIEILPHIRAGLTNSM